MSNYKGANLSLKCTKTRLVAGLCPEPLGGAYVLHQTPNCNGRPPKRWDGRRGGLHLRGTEGRREGKGISPQRQGEYNKYRP